VPTSKLFLMSFWLNHGVYRDFGRTFQILKQKYRNRRKRYNLRVNLICGLINFDRGMMVLKK